MYWKRNMPNNRPKPFVPVMLYIPTADPLPSVAEGYVDDAGLYHAHRFMGEIFVDAEVTHWAETPKPPTVKQKDGVNTKIVYSYYDDDNNETKLEEIVKGTFSSEEKAALVEWLKWKAKEEKEEENWNRFRPWKVGFEDKSDFNMKNDYHELVDFIPVKQPSTVNLTIHDFVFRLKTRRKGRV